MIGFIVYNSPNKPKGNGLMNYLASAIIISIIIDRVFCRSALPTLVNN